MFASLILSKFFYPAAWAGEQVQASKTTAEEFLKEVENRNLSRILFLSLLTDLVYINTVKANLQKWAFEKYGQKSYFETPNFWIYASVLQKEKIDPPSEEAKGCLKRLKQYVGRYLKLFPPDFKKLVKEVSKEKKFPKAGERFFLLGRRKASPIQISYLKCLFS